MGKPVKESHPKESLYNFNRRQKLKSYHFAAESLKIPKTHYEKGKKEKMETSVSWEIKSCPRIELA